MRRDWTKTIGGRFMPHIGTIGFFFIYLKVVTCDNFAWYRYMVNILVFSLSPRVHYKIVMQVPFVFFRAIFIYLQLAFCVNKSLKLAASGLHI